MEEHKIPLLGVMGAFVFAAQMINFPVGIGTSGHLVGGALLAYTLGPFAATVVMTAILAIQALVFQDGGILALGANLFNMAIAGVFAGYLPFHLWGNGAHRRIAIFAGGVLSVLVSAVLALSELLISGVRMPGAVLGVSLALFLVSALLEGAITLAVVQSLETIRPKFIHVPAGERRFAMRALLLAAVFLAAVGILFASANPDGIWKLAGSLGIASHVSPTIASPLADYQMTSLRSPWLRRASAGLIGLAIIYGVCVLLGTLLSKKRAAAIAPRNH
jgi:cobalt/nickel transport system permease protein